MVFSFIWHVIPSLIDLSPYNFRSEIFRFRARRSKNYEAYTLYMLNNFYEVAAEIWKLQPKGYKGTSLINPFTFVILARFARASARRAKAGIQTHWIQRNVKRLVGDGMSYAISH